VTPPPQECAWNPKPESEAPVHLHCTKKLLASLGYPHLDQSLPANPLFGWHAHIVSIARAKTIVAINDHNFFAVIMPGIKKAQLKNFAHEFHLALAAALASEQWEDSHLDVLFGGHIAYAKTHDRQVLGIINQVVQDMECHVQHTGGWKNIDVIALTKKMNRIPWLASTRHTIFPIDQLTKDLDSLSPGGSSPSAPRTTTYSDAARMLLLRR